MSLFNVWRFAIVLLVSLLAACGGGGGSDGGSGQSGSGAPPASGGGGTPPVTVILPVIASQPQSQTVLEGNNAVFEVLMTVLDVYTYQWRRNGVDIPGEKSQFLAITPAVLADNSAIFSVVITNANGTATSVDATLTVTARPVIPPDPAEKTWTTSRLTAERAIFPSYLYKPFDPADGLMWLGVEDGGFNIRQAAYSGTSWATTQLVGGLDEDAATTATYVRRNGNWAVYAWSPTSTDHLNVWARIIGPGVDTGGIKISTITASSGYANSLRAAISTDGHVAFVWEQNKKLYQRFYFNGVFSEVEDKGAIQNISAFAELPDGEARLFTAVSSLGSDVLVHYYSYKFDAANGVSGMEQIDNNSASWARLYSLAVFNEGGGDFSVIWIKDAGAGKGCIGSSRLKDNIWSTPVCINNTEVIWEVNPDNPALLAGNKEGEILVAWLNSDKNKVTTARRSAAGVWSSPVVAVSGTSYIWNWGDIALSSNGAGVVLFTREKDSKTELYALVGNGADVWDAPYKVGDTTLAIGNFVTVAINDEGEPALMWLEHTTQDSLYFRSKTASGWGSAMTIASGISMTATLFGSTHSFVSLKLFQQANGNWGALWEQKDVDGKAIYAGSLE